MYSASSRPLSSGRPTLHEWSDLLRVLSVHGASTLDVHDFGVGASEKIGDAGCNLATLPRRAPGKLFASSQSSLIESCAGPRPIRAPGRVQRGRGRDLPTETGRKHPGSHRRAAAWAARAPPEQGRSSGSEWVPASRLTLVAKIGYGQNCGGNLR
jgi:hypothetical protein